MDASIRRRRRPLRWVLVGSAVIAVVLVGTKVVVSTLDRADPVDVAKVVEEFERSAVSSTSLPAGADGPSILATGAFVYDATGTEFIDLLGAPVHTLPAEVVATVEANDCGGFTVDLQLFEQRNDLIVLCPTGDGDLSFARYETRHEFVGIKDETVTTCPENRVWSAQMLAEGSGPDVSVRCSATGPNIGSAPAVLSRKVVGREDVMVDGESVETTHLRLSTAIGQPSDAAHGTYDSEFWISSAGLIVRRTLEAEVSAAAPIGHVGFKESFDVTLQQIP